MATAKKHGGKRAGAGVKPAGVAKMPNGSIRMSPKQWKTFEAWGGADRLRKVLDHWDATNKGKAAPKRLRV